MISRRTFLNGLTAGAVLGSGWSRLCLAGAASGQRRFVLIILRGGLDGLAAVAPYGDPDYEPARKGLALEPPGNGDGLLDLDGSFALHPALAGLHQRFRQGELVAVHAVASPYRERSHFDAQNVLELGLGSPHESRRGWLNRALDVLDTGSAAQQQSYAMGIGQSLPLVLRGPRNVGSWAPAWLPDPDEDLMTRLSALYADDAFLGPRLESALAADRMAGVSGSPMGKGGRRDQFLALAEAAGRLLGNDPGPRIAVVEAGGWDTHANQGRESGGLAQRLGRLDKGIAKLADTLGPAWQETVVLVVTEFGRTVAMNGTRGTDHGTASVALVLGGAVRGGRVLGDWPGLATRSLHDGRDLRPTTDVRGIYKAVLRDHLSVDANALEERVFPGSRSAPAMEGLIRV
jgi:uncharacterized protein (DUF1501 family)